MKINYSLLFIIHSGELEIKSLLLALSMKEQADPGMEMIAAVPRTGNRTLYPSQETLTCLKNAGIKVVVFDNPYLSENKGDPGDLFTNKSFCLKIPSEGEYTVFLDSDIICLNKMNLHNIALPDFASKQVDFANVRNWDRLYSNFNMETPVERIECTVDRQLSPPYFNSGVFIVRYEIREELADTWFNIFREITDRKLMQDNLLRRHQASLAIAVHKLGLSFTILAEEYNFPARSKKKMDPDRVIFAHYHDVATAVRVVPLRKSIDRMMVTYPSLAGIMEYNKTWRRYFTGKLRWFFKVQIRWRSEFSNLFRILRKFRS